MSTLVSSACTIIKATAPGLPSRGGVSIPGLQPGDLVVKASPQVFAFEEVVSVADQLQQIDNLDWSTVNFTLYLLRGV